MRGNGESKELKDEVTALPKKYGITTPYTSYLIVRDGPLPVAGGGRLSTNFMGGMNGQGAGIGGFGGATPPRLTGPAGAAKPVYQFAKENQAKPGELAQKRDKLAEEGLLKLGDAKGPEEDGAGAKNQKVA